MMKIRSALAGATLLAAGAAASPAFAGQSTATGTATFAVVSQCSVTGANVDLGTYRVTDTFQVVADTISYINASSTWVAGSRGAGSMNLGSITCSNNLPYTLRIKGPGAFGAAVLDIGSKRVAAGIYISKIGNQTQTDAVVPGLGAYVSADAYSAAVGIGTGVPQAVMGTIPLGFAGLKTANAGTAELIDQLGTTGSFSSSLTYTLTF